MLKSSHLDFPVGKIGFWLFIVFSVLFFLMLVVGQTSALISYNFAVKLGLQETAHAIGLFGISMNKGYAVADTIIQLPLLIFAVIGFVFRKRWGIGCMAGVMAITAYWPVACLSTLFFAKGLPGIHFQGYVNYSIVLVTISLIGLYGLVYLCKKLQITKPD